MKTTRFLMLVLHFTAATAGLAQITDPGWFEASGLTRTPPPIAGSNAIPLLQQLDTYNPLDVPSQQAIAEVITPEIQTLANGLQNDPVRIFNYVHDHIRHVFYFGSKKGAQLTLLEKSGNDFDQCALLMALLRAAGYNNATYQFGWMLLPYDIPDGTDRDLHHWLQLSLVNTDWLATSNYLAKLIYNRGYPTYAAIWGNNVFAFQRVWITMTDGAKTYYLDPSFKVSEPFTGPDLVSPMGLSSNGVSTAAGGTVTTTSVSGLNESRLRNTLTGYTTNLLNFFQTNYPNTSVEGILGGWEITPSTNTALPQTLFFTTTDFGGAFPFLNWTNQPTNLMSQLTISFAGTNYQWFMPQLEGQRVSLTYDTNGVAQLWQEDTLLVQKSTTSSDTTVALLAHHPVGIWSSTNTFIDEGAFDQNVTNSYQRTNATYALLYAFEPDWGWLRERQNQLDAYRQQGLGDTSRQVVSETLNIMGLNWMLQSSGAEQVLAAQLNMLPENIHRLGRMGQEAGRGYYVDVYMQLSSPMPDSGWDAASQEHYFRHFELKDYFASALEHGIIEQLQSSNLLAASTVKMLEIASTNGQTVYLTWVDNWTSGANVKSHLVNYDTTTLNTLTAYINAGNYVLLPQNGSNHIAGASTWAGYGYVVLGNGMSFIIGGGYHGGFSQNSTDTANPGTVATTWDMLEQAYALTPQSTPNVTAGDPVDMADGTFQVQQTDLSLGLPEPRGISLSRYYNGTRRYSNPVGMAGGWLHNYFVNAATVAAPQAGLGSTTPAQMAPMIVATCAAISYYDDSAADVKNWTTTALIAKWGIDQLTKNGVSVTLGKDTLQFVRQPNGLLTPPANCTYTLTGTNVYTLQERRGNAFKFDSNGRLTNIVDQYNQSLKLTYNSSNWVQTVVDWKGHTLTFNYTGSPQRLTSVTDSTGRMVSYGYSTAYNAQGDLVSFTDAENKTNTFVYDTNHQITATFDAIGQLVVSNVYDSLGHIAVQYTQGDTNKAWKIFWSGWQNTEQDPTGSQRVFSYDDKSRLVSVRDALTNETDMFYDGQNHLVFTISPLNELNEYVYDGNHNLLLTYDSLEFSNQFLYDSQFNLISQVDARGNTNRFGYNTKFQLTGQTNGAGDWVTFAYNSADGSLTNRTDPGGTTSYAYNTNGYVRSITYPGGLGSEGFMYDVLGNVIMRTNGNGFVTSFQYNQRRGMTNIIGPTNVTAKVSYDAVGNVSSTTDARGNTVSNTWSATRKLMATTFPATPSGTAVVRNAYDNRDWLVRFTNALGKTTQFGYDAAQRRIRMIDPLLRTNSFGFDADGRATSSTNAALEITSQQFNLRGELTKLTDPATNIILRAYDEAGNQTLLTNRNRNKWQFQFDGANRLTNTITPLNRQMYQIWNNRGLPAATREPSAQWSSNFFDARGRLTNTTDQAGVRVFRYDGNNNLTNVFEGGRSNVWTYDAYNRISSCKDADGNVIQYRYDANGNLTNLIYPGNRTVAYSYDSLNRLTNVTDWGNRQTAIAYDLANRVTSISRPNNIIRTINYDAAGQITNIIEQTASGFPIAFFKLNWNNAARVQWEFAAPLPHVYTAPANTMTFDADNRLATLNGQNVTNDLDGNMIWGPLTNASLVNYSYDARNRLLSADGTSYGYNPAGNRTSLTNGTNVVRFVINPNAGLSQVLMRTKSGTTNYYIYGPGLLYEITETATGTNTLTYHFDLRGSTIAVTDSGGNVKERFEYSMYGALTYRSDSTDTPFLFNGRYGVMTDPNGLLYMRARYYNPFICRFINADPSGFVGGLNFYAYADGNPVSLLDPFGLGAGKEGFWTWLGDRFSRLFDPSEFPTEGQIAHAAIDNVISSAIGLSAPEDIQRPMAYNFHSYDPNGTAPQWADIAMITTSIALGLPEDSPEPIPSARTPSLVPSGLGDLTILEVEQIQAAVEKTGQPVTVVGSAARGTRRGVGSDLPMMKGPGGRSDIDYVIEKPYPPFPSDLDDLDVIVSKLPDINPGHGPIRGTFNANEGPGIRFEPGKSPVVLPGN